jgi:protein SCO1/2
VPGEPPAGALDLTADDGTPFDLAALRGRPVLVYFGYTSCPDVCPATTGVLAEVVRASADPPRVVFVTVDPERDTAAVLHRYLSYLPAGFVGLTGSAAAVRTAADAFGVDYARVDTGSASGYTMAHTADVTLVDADGLVRARFPFGTGAAEIAAASAAVAR